MVKTFLCHPFSAPKAFTDQYEPTSICYTVDDRIIIGSSLGAIHIHNLKHGGCPKLQKFPCVGVPVKLLFCDHGQFIISLEARAHDFKTGVSVRNLNCQVRAYVNITSSAVNKAHSTVTNGYTANNKTNFKNFVKIFTVIDISVQNSASDITLCSIKNNLAVSSTNKVHIFAYKEVQFEGGVLIDFFRLIEVESKFRIRSISLSANWLALASRKELRVVQIFVSQPEDQNVYQAEDVSELLESCVVNSSIGTGSTKIPKEIGTNQANVNNSIILDENFVVWNFDQCCKDVPVSSSTETKDSFLSSSSFTTDKDKGLIKLHSIKEETPYVDRQATAKEVLGPYEELVGHPLRCSVIFTFPNNGSTFYGSVSCITLLYRRFETDELSSAGKSDTIHSVQWLPVFMEGQYSSMLDVSNCCWPWDVFQLPPSATLLTHAFFFSTGKHGYIYDIAGSVKLVKLYNYTSDCFSAVHSKSMLYTITKSGLEMYTSRLYSLASEQCQMQFKDTDVDAVTFKPHAAITPYHERNRANTELFMEQNYFESYISVSFETSMDSLSMSQNMAGRDDSLSDARSQTFDLLTLPVYSPRVLNQVCPSVDIDVCLIGMYVLQNIRFVGASTSYIILLVKSASNKDKQSPSWSIYALEKAAIGEFYEEIIRLVTGNEYSNPTVCYQLLCEAHLMLRSELVSGTSEEEDIKILLKESALKMADLLASYRCDSAFDYKKIIEYYSMAELSLTEVTNKFMNESSTKMKTFVFGPGMLEYLNYFLFSDKEVDLDKEASEFILKIYLKSQPQMLSKVILKSKLKNFSDDLAVKFMSKFKRKQEGKVALISHFDYLCLAALHMNLGNPGHAEELLKEISDVSLQKICVQNVSLLFDPVHLITPLGQLIKKHFTVSFNAILLQLFDAGNFTVENILQLFKKCSEDTTEEVFYSYKVCDVLETLLDDSTRKKDFTKIAVLLMRQYINKLTNGISPDGWKSNHHHIPKGSGHFAPRFSWLDKVHPFTGDPPSPQDCILNKATQKRNHLASSNNQTTAMSLPFSPLLPGKGSHSMHSSGSPSTQSRGSLEVASSPSNKKLIENLMKRDYCPCCCCSETLLKFHSLLCSRYNRKDLSIQVINMLSDASFVGKESLLLLCWPKAGNVKDAVEYMVKNYPTSSLQYAKELFDWKMQWQQLLQHVVVTLRNNDYEQWNHDAYIAVLKGVLLRLMRAYTPAEFLSLLPTDGSVQFFLPYLHECWEYSQSTSLKKEFLNMYQETTQSIENN